MTKYEIPSNFELADDGIGRRPESTLLSYLDPVMMMSPKLTIYVLLLLLL